MMAAMKNFLIHRIIALGFIAITLGACGGGVAIGAACTKENAVDECESGALCAKTASAALQCQEICAAQTDCSNPDTHNCNGLTGSAQKVCQPK
jgi:hypothetical protein